MTQPQRLRFLTLGALMAPALASAHSAGIGGFGGFTAGLAHPLLGLDHLLAMVAVGLWATQCGGSRVSWLPLTFVTAMTAAGVAAMAGIALPLVEGGILLSVLLLGLAVAMGTRLPLPAAIATVGVFAAFHGHAHGAEIPAAASGLSYAAGFALATALLHLGGIGLGRVLMRVHHGLTRYAGAGIALSGVALATL